MGTLATVHLPDAPLITSFQITCLTKYTKPYVVAYDVYDPSHAFTYDAGHVHVAPSNSNPRAGYYDLKIDLDGIWDRPLCFTYSLYFCNLLPMPRRARHIFIDIPHHLTKRGNYRQPVFCSDDDYLCYLESL